MTQPAITQVLALPARSEQYGIDWPALVVDILKYPIMEFGFSKKKNARNTFHYLGSGHY